jgi:ABC-type nickel/cobalt efflux system permease component RcnA
MSENNENIKCNGTVIKRLLAYFNKHNLQATMLVAALSLGFVISVICVGYAVILQAKTGCLTFFMK